MIAREISDIIEEFAPISLQESWDNSGFCIGDSAKEVNSVLIGLDCTPSLVEEAISVGADMIITHHPLIFNGVKRISSETLEGRIIIEAIKNDIVIYSAHTNIDKVIGGVSGQMAKRLDLEDVEILDVDVDNYGLGVVGNLKSPVKAKDLVQTIKKQFSLEFIKSSEVKDVLVNRIALCGGSGKSLIPKAISSRADIYITGDVSYHDFLSNPDLLIIDIGHFESEIDIVKTIYSILREKIPTFTIQIAKNNNPVYYY